MILKYERQIADQTRRLRALEEQGEGMRLQRYQRALERLAEDVEFDLDDEIERCAGMGDREFVTRLAQIRSANAAPGKALEHPDVERKIHRYMRENPELIREHGERAFKEAAKALKIIV